jgi:glycosyltransferase involved in cell wall biosynthesis
MGPRSLIKRLYRDIRKNFGKNKDTNYKWNIIAKEVNSTDNNKKIIITNLDRSDLIQAFLNSDLFVFASNIEYSPLVLFESAAAGLPFLTVQVGNSKEIIEWTKGGVLCPATIDNNSRTVVSPQILAKEIMKLESDPEKRATLGKQGRSNWEKRYSWEKITFEYEKVLQGNYN